jgi:hypothetical protein
MRRVTARVRRTWSALSTGERVVLVAWAMIALQLVLRGWAVAGSWFYADDFIFLGTVARGEATTDWLFSPHNIHLMPLGLWLTTLVGAVGAFSWTAAVAEILVLQLLASLACWWMLRTFFGDRPGILVPLGAFLFLPMSFPTVVWWAAVVNQLPHQAALYACLAAHVVYLRERRRWALVMATVFFALALGSYTKGLLVPVLLVLVAVLYFAEGGLLRRPWRALVDYWQAWTAYGVVTAGYLVTYLTTVPSTGRPDLQVLADTVDLSLTTSLAPSMLGGPWVWTSLNQVGGVGPRLFVDTPASLVALSWLVLGMLALVAVLRRRRAWFAILVLAVYALASAVLVGAGRAGDFGVASASLELRYFADLSGVVALCLGLALLPVRGAVGSSEPRTPVVLDLHVGRRWVAAGLAVVLAGSLWSSFAYARPWHDPEQMPQEQWIANATEGLTAEPVEIPDTPVPDSVLWAAGFPANLVSRLLSPLGDRVQVVDQGTDLKMLDDRGRLRPATIPDVPRTQPGPDGACGYAVRESTKIQIVPVLDFDFWLTISYLGAQDGTMTVSAGRTETELPVERGPHTAYVRTQGAYDSVTLTPAPGTTLCVDNLNVGFLAPLDVPEEEQ